MWTLFSLYIFSFPKPKSRFYLYERKTPDRLQPSDSETGLLLFFILRRYDPYKTEITTITMLVMIRNRTVNPASLANALTLTDITIRQVILLLFLHISFSFLLPSFIYWLLSFTWSQKKLIAKMGQKKWFIFNYFLINHFISA